MTVLRRLSPREALCSTKAFLSLKPQKTPYGRLFSKTLLGTNRCSSFLAAHIGDVVLRDWRWKGRVAAGTCGLAAGYKGDTIHRIFE